MHIISDFNSDTRNIKRHPGGYEWWYFDAIDEKSDCRIVIIFYEGNPFSPRYIRARENKETTGKALPERFPAVSVSVYRNGSAAYYSFTDYGESETRFDTETPRIDIGGHRMDGRVEEGATIYDVTFEETLPSGSGIRGKLTFKSPEVNENMFTDGGDSAAGHEWNLVQPRAEVGGNIDLYVDDEITDAIQFRGTGYHDHNTGEEPMRDEFESWYWGRFHFRQSTLAYYVMNRKSGQQQQAWLISADNATILQRFDKVKLLDKGLSLFGLNTARRIKMRQNSTTITIQQKSLLDNGPFYQRFDSNAFLAVPEEGVLEHVRGITEFICPGRIYWRIFWPLVNMRIRFSEEDPHWVQKSDTLYRWTW